MTRAKRAIYLLLVDSSAARSGEDMVLKVALSRSQGAPGSSMHLRG